MGSPTTHDSAIGSPTTRDLATGLFEKWRLRQKSLRPESENRKFQQDWLGGPRGLITIEYVGNEFSFPTILGNEFLFPRKRIFVSRKRKYGVDRFAPNRASDDADTVIGRSMRKLVRTNTSRPTSHLTCFANDRDNAALAWPC